MKAPAESVAAPLEPSQPESEARKFRIIDKGFRDGTMLSGTWIDKIMAEFAAAVSKNLQEELAEINRVIMERFGELKCSTKDDEGNQLDASDLVCILATRLELSRRNFAKAETRISGLEKEITALRETK